MEQLRKDEIIKELTARQITGNILLIMPDDLIGLYKEALQNRLKPLGVHLVIKSISEDNMEVTEKDHLFVFEGDLISSPFFETPAKPVDSEPPNRLTNAVKIKGEFIELQTSGSDIMSQYKTILDHKADQLKKEIVSLENKEPTKKLLENQNQIRLILLKVNQKKHQIDTLKKEIGMMDQAYYDRLSTFIKSAIDSILQLVTLGDVMKRYIKILLIDDLGDRSLSELESRGFRKRNISHLTAAEINRAYKIYRQKREKSQQGISVSFNGFLKHCSLFDPYEIVIFNTWRVEAGTLNIHFRLKQSPELSRKEIRQLNEDPEIKATHLNSLHKKREEVEYQLRSVETDLHKAETEGSLGEQAYVSLNKKRKRILKELNRKLEEIKNLNKEISGKPIINLYQWDLLAPDKQKKTKSGFIKKKDPDTITLLKLADLVKKSKEEERLIRHMNKRIKALISEMDKLAESHPIHADKPYQQVLGIHALNRVEYAIIDFCRSRSLAAIHLARHPYFLTDSNSNHVNWDSEPVSNARVHIASKNLSINTEFVKKFFRIDLSSISDRLSITPTLPSKTDFEKKHAELLIINTESFPIPRIFDCLMDRNNSDNPAFPVLLYDPHGSLQKQGVKIKADLLAGVMTSKSHSGVSPIPYYCHKLDENEFLPAVCFNLGIDETTVPDFNAPDSHLDERSEALSIDSMVSADSPNTDYRQASREGISDSSRLEDPANEFDPQGSGSRHDDSLIEIVEEEIYTLNSLFSFDDEVTARHSDLKNTDESQTDQEDINEVSETSSRPDGEGEGDIGSDLPKRDADDADGEENELYDSSHLF